MKDGDDLYEVFSIMVTQGGGFARSLAHAWFRADIGNKMRIEDAFPDFVEKYREIVKIVGDQHAD